MSSNILSGLVPLMNSDRCKDKSEGVSTTGKEVVEVMRTFASVYVLCPCDTCILIFQRTKEQS